MRPTRLSEIARWTGGRLRGEDRTVDAVATDTRALPQGGAAVFVALKGERFDGHDHAPQAVQGGVAALLVARELDLAVPQVVVADTERALGDWAAAVQRGRAATVVAITGSNGKTSVKTLTAAILARHGRAYANPGNRNNEIGLPLAVLEAPEDAQYAVYEMGAGKPGDIAYLTAIAPPHVGLVNNVAPAHIERMGSLLAIADTKAAVYDDLRDGGTAVINADDAFAQFFAECAHGRRLIRFGLEQGADVSARDLALGEAGSRFVLVSPAGEAAVEIAMPGRHNVRNALAAASIAFAAGAPLATVAEGLAAARPVAGRLATHALRSGAVLIDDSYNANPGSLAAAIETLAEAGRGAGGEAWLVLGDMRELGADAAGMHAEVGRRARAAGVTRLFALGPFSAHAARAFGDGAARYERHDTLAEALRAQLRGGVRVLVKGSRGSAMDKIVTALLAADAREAGGDDHAA
ncbi:UDP-N-acetylmuramoyl-tripeptide--D-alanyl-D-alanine ligase [Vulcaniibacterium tengchongense]|uniref:UDP-N-acetylmuramoyl-tripeptide--D-alanyl-D-alanine ligase n=1 Tax=Vulcaniibacterium tengchongense TaxID=1273429 RepID=A0A3N4VR50_9GAMM|nr:UDP-N-acetylmuramoyl-tripeptide--D-alanyl-D-alanine ligase [Vulcaniibacterium tengchongense]RPE79527.1 UDP-N-acetylmuramoyl-tripeptide--D-alanyl-D-alanine ligase [Vulcaniibacterium tengchongense]